MVPGEPRAEVLPEPDPLERPTGDGPGDGVLRKRRPGRSTTATRQATTRPAIEPRSVRSRRRRQQDHRARPCCRTRTRRRRHAKSSGKRLKVCSDAERGPDGEEPGPARRRHRSPAESVEGDADRTPAVSGRRTAEFARGQGPSDGVGLVERPTSRRRRPAPRTAPRARGRRPRDPDARRCAPSTPAIVRTANQAATIATSTTSARCQRAAAARGPPTRSRRRSRGSRPAGGVRASRQSGSGHRRQSSQPGPPRRSPRTAGAGRPRTSGRAGAAGRPGARRDRCRTADSRRDRCRSVRSWRPADA